MCRQTLSIIASGDKNEASRWNHSFASHDDGSPTEMIEHQPVTIRPCMPEHGRSESFPVAGIFVRAVFTKRGESALFAHG